jgi:hypothetical protein
MVKECVWAETDVVVFEIPPDGGLWTSAFSIVTLWEWPLSLEDVNDRLVAGLLGLVELLEQLGRPTASRIRKANPATAAGIFLAVI